MKNYNVHFRFFINHFFYIFSSKFLIIFNLFKKKLAIGRNGVTLPNWNFSQPLYLLGFYAVNKFESLNFKQIYFYCIIGKYYNKSSLHSKMQLCQ